MAYFISVGICVIIALVLHEMAHGYMSYYLGDPTPKREGRLSVNPLKHLDPIGTLCLFFFHFGWAKPVMINPTYYKNQKMGTMLVALAGPLMNFVLAFIGAIFLKICYSFNLVNLLDFFILFISINVGLGVFNLIPFPPLDGSKLLLGILPDKMYNFVLQYEMYGMFILVFLLYLGILNTPLSSITNAIMNVLLSIVGL